MNEEIIASLANSLEIKKALFKRPDILLDYYIPSQMWGVNPRSIMPVSEWKKIRKKVIDKNNGCCWSCGKHFTEAKNIHAHERYQYSLNQDDCVVVRLLEIVALCVLCHDFCHLGRLKIMLEERKVKQSHYNQVMNNARDVLSVVSIFQWEYNKILPPVYTELPKEFWFFTYNNSTRSVLEWQKIIS